MILIIHPQHYKWKSKWSPGCQGSDVARQINKGRAKEKCVCVLWRKCMYTKTSPLCVGLYVLEWALRVNVHVLEQIIEHKCVCLFIWAGGGGQGSIGAISGFMTVYWGHKQGMRLTLTLLMAVNHFIIVGPWCVKKKRHMQEMRFNTSVQLTPRIPLAGLMGLWGLEKQYLYQVAS